MTLYGQARRVMLGEDGVMPATLARMVDSAWITEVLDRVDPLPRGVQPGVGVNEDGLRRFFQSNKVPFGVIDGFVNLAADGVLRNRWPINTDLIGVAAEGPDRVYLGRPVTRIELRESVPEVSHFDQMGLIVVGQSARERPCLPECAVLRAVFGRRVSPRQGDIGALAFSDYLPRADGRAVFREGVGHYSLSLSLSLLPATTRGPAALVRAGIRRSWAGLMVSACNSLSWGCRGLPGDVGLTI